MVTSFKTSHAGTATCSAPNPAAGLLRPTPPLETPGHSRASPGQCPVGSLLLSPGSWCLRFFLCPPRDYFPVLCKFWQLYGGVNGDLLQEGLCHTQVCWHPEHLPLQQATADPYLPFKTLKGKSGSVSVWCPGAHKVLFEPSKHLWWHGV